MGTPTRFPGGITTAFPTSNLNNYGMPDPTKWITFFDDLLNPAAALGTFTAVDGLGGLVTVATTNAIDTPKASFVPTSGKVLLFKAKASTPTVATVGIVAGIADVISGAATKGITVSIMNNVLTLTNEYAGTTDTATVAYAVNKQFTFGFEYRSDEGIIAYFNDVAVATLPAPTFDTTALLAGLYADGGTITADYIFAAQER